MTKKALIGFSAICLLLTAACNSQHRVEVAPVEVKPIHITIDVNVRVERALEDFFGDIDEAEEKIEKSSSADK